MNTHWISRPHDPYLRTVGSSELVMSTGNAMLFALRLDCGHTVYAPCGRLRSTAPPARYRCKRCIQEAIGEQPVQRRPTPAEAIVAGYGAGATGGVMDAARAAIALEVVS